MNRREMLEWVTAAGLTTASVVVSAADTPAAPEKHDMQNMPGMAHHNHAASATKYPALLAAASECINTAEACLAHCIAQLTAGDLEMKNCAITSQDVISACTALRQMAARNAPRVAQLAAVCGKVCRDCEAECKKHETHQVCRDCRDSCAKCAQECERIAA